MNLEELFDQYKEQSIAGRYLTLDHIKPLLEKLNTNNQVKIIGTSVLGEPIYSYEIGTGETRIYLWSQMHGNESTTTKALFDFINVLNSGSEFAEKMLKTFTFYSIPILNPDGARLYTRENANKIDLNRDSQNLTQPESKVLREVFETFKPDYCFNLHDQRTIFGAGETGKPATVSFLAPSYNEEREINDNRLKAINVIAGINDVLQKYIPGQVGRFDDSFNINCIGDTFQFLGVPTILFEGGHFPNDYDREITRKLLFFSLITSFKLIGENDLVDNRIHDYLNISQNKVVFYDFMYKNIKINYDGIEIITNFVAQYKEELIENKIHFNAYIVEVGELENYFGHFEYDAKGAVYSDDFTNFPKMNQKADFYLDKNVKFVNGLIKS
ncbi:zinc carboxypeptidase [Flavobacterium sp. 90]|uniref:M14 family metallopeptidase n=1 Tax=unclassified Flavobacterium TaxID=196869 RepID=UPI000EB53F34|nr:MULTISPECIES: M14 metallopeptidase family protein [unclassified Flavobacterium]RKR05327.1 zinc carboxypeptidase [Flavobacterium sp. 81]TCK56641.1 zinc carboxypeptidase [Flavobacterium sp. 90]